MLYNNILVNEQSHMQLISLQDNNKIWKVSVNCGIIVPFVCLSMFRMFTLIANQYVVE